MQQITDFAVQHGYKGIEVRGLQRQVDLTRCPEFSILESRKAAMALMKEKDLKFVNLGSSANLHLAVGADRDKNLAKAKSFIYLAKQINCPLDKIGGRQ